MSRKRHQGSRSQFPSSTPSSGQKIEPERRDEYLTRAEDLFNAGKPEQALRDLNLAPKWIKQSPEYNFLRSMALIRTGEVDAGGEILREMERKQPRFISLYFPLAVYYMAKGWPAHALRAMRKFINSVEYELGEKTITSVQVEAKQIIQGLADELSIPYSQAEQASWHNEQAQLAFLDGSTAEEGRQSEEALKLAPDWAAPRNNLAQSLYWKGDCRRAIMESESVLVAEPENAHTLKNLTIYYAGLGETTKAASYALRLFSLATSAISEPLIVELAIQALSGVEDDAHLWGLTKRCLQLKEQVLNSYAWHCLGIAAVRNGKFLAAKKLLERTGKDISLPAIADEMKEVQDILKGNEKRPMWPFVYPVVTEFLPDRLLEEWGSLIKNIPDNLPSPAQQHKINMFIERYPFALVAFKRILWSRVGCLAGASSLVLVNRSDADAEIIRFATSDCGDKNSRMEAIMMLIEAGRYSTDAPIKFWDEARGEWRDVLLFNQEIGPVDLHIQPDVADLINQGRRTKDPRESIRLLRQAVEKDPSCAMALHNLGAVLFQEGSKKGGDSRMKKEGEMLMKQSIEVDPSYIFGFANLGFQEAQRGNEKAALDYLDHVNKAKVITPETAILANLAHTHLAIQRNDLEQARVSFEMARKIDSGSPIVKEYGSWLEEIELLSETSNFISNYQRKSANRFHKKMLGFCLSPETTLQECLLGLPTDVITGICAFWNTSSSGKKVYKVKRLVECIFDQDVFQSVIGGLEADLIEALRWVVTGGGKQPWDGFIKKFGDDLDEPSRWIYHEPESLPGRLKQTGLLFVGTLEGKPVAFIPADIRLQIKQFLGE